MTNNDQNLLVPEALGEVTGRGRLTGRRIIVVGGGQISLGLENEPYGNGLAMYVHFEIDWLNVEY